MKDSTDKNNELDQYGVWVKTPPHSADANSAPHTSESIDETLPDFSFLDTPSESAEDASKDKPFEQEDTSLTPDELSHITGSVAQSEPAEEHKSGEEEISLDDFITGGFTEEPADTAATKPSQPEEMPKETTSAQTPSFSDGDVSLDDFLGSSTNSSSTTTGDVSLDDFMSSSSSTQELKPEELSDEKPMDIDLSFDDSMTVQEDNQAVETPAVEDSPVEAPAEEAAPSTEEVDLSSFDMNSTDTAKASSNDSTKVDLDNFDSVFNTIVDEGGTAPAANGNTSTVDDAPAADGTESVNLSDFGIDSDSGEQNIILPGSAPAEKPKEDVDYTMNVTTDEETAAPEPVSDVSASEEKEDSVVIDAQPEENSSPVVSSDTAAMGAPSDDDFDVDSILNSVKDEQGKTVCVGNTADAVSKDVDSVPLEEPSVVEQEIVPETIEELNQTPNTPIDQEITISSENETIPDTFEEETAFLSTNDKDNSDNSDISEYLPDDIAKTIDNTSVSEPADQDALSFTEQPTADVPSSSPTASEIESVTSSETTSEETASAEESPAEEPVPTTEAVPVSETASSTPSLEMDEENRAILKQIAGELSSLKAEISGLKSEFEDLRKSAPLTASIEPAKEEKSEGFFSGTDEDDTIALSGDELNNILNNADFTTAQTVETAAPVASVAPVEEPVAEEAPVEAAPVEAETLEEVPSEETSVVNKSSDSVKPQQVDDNPLGSMESVEIPEQDDFDSEAPANLKMDFSNEKLEEPVFDTVDFTTPVADDLEADKTLPNEIAVPKVDDVLVESSNTDLMETDVTTAEEPSPVENTLVEEAEELPPAKAEILPANNISKPVDIFKEEEPSPLTEDKLNYLSSDDKADDSVLETGIGEEPVDTVFSQWDNSSSTKENHDEQPSPEPAKQNATPSSIPTDMKQEIKSVLSYMDQLLENLPEEKITEFAQSEQFETYKKLFVELGLA